MLTIARAHDNIIIIAAEDVILPSCVEQQKSIVINSLDVEQFYICLVYSHYVYIILGLRVLREQERQSLPHTVPDVNQPGMAAARGGRDRTRPLSANTIRERAQQSLEESARRLKAIEVRDY